MPDFLPWGGREYYCFLCALLFGRGMDFLSTYVATPHLVLEGNPLARLMGWKFGGVVNLILCVWLGRWPMTAVIITTTSLLVASRNFQMAWLMRTMGEQEYRRWFVEKVFETPPSLYVFCLLSQTVLTSLIGVALLWFDGLPMAIGMGIVAYGVTVLFYTMLSRWRMRRSIS